MIKAPAAATAAAVSTSCSCAVQWMIGWMDQISPSCNSTQLRKNEKEHSQRNVAAVRDNTPLLYLLVLDRNVLVGQLNIVISVSRRTEHVSQLASSGATVRETLLPSPPVFLLPKEAKRERGRRVNTLDAQNDQDKASGGAREG